MDTVENEKFYSSIFRDLNPKWWYKRESWKYVPILPFTGYRPDAWHIAKSLMIICLMAAVVTYTVMVSQVLDILIGGAAWNLSFNVLYGRFTKGN